MEQYKKLFNDENQEEKKTMNVLIEASIGVGKSTLIKNLDAKLSNSNEFSTTVFLEPVELWENTKAGNLLHLFSKDQTKYALATQTHIMTTMHQQRINPPKTDVRIYERSFLSAKNVFQAVLEEKGYLNEMECLILDNLGEVLSKNMPIQHKIIYSRASPELAYQRTKERNGTSDKLLTPEYFELLEKKHEKMIKDLIASGIDILILEASENQEVVANKAAEWIKHKMKVTKKSQENKKNENDKEMQ